MCSIPSPYRGILFKTLSPLNLTIYYCVNMESLNTSSVIGLYGYRMAATSQVWLGMGVQRVGMCGWGRGPFLDSRGNHPF